MGEAVKSALTAEEWAKAVGDRGHVAEGVELPNTWVTVKNYAADIGEVTLDVEIEDERDRFVTCEREDAHALAALCLYGQPFGFTHQMAKDLRDYAMDYGNTPRLLSIAERIESLLPPPGE